MLSILELDRSLLACSLVVTVACLCVLMYYLVLCMMAAGCLLAMPAVRFVCLLMVSKRTLAPFPFSLFSNLTCLF